CRRETEERQPLSKPSRHLPGKFEIQGLARARTGQAAFIEVHAAAIRHTVIAVENAIGIAKKYIQLNTVVAAKHDARAHAVTRRSRRDCAGRPPSCHARIAASKRKTLTNRPNPT